MATHSSDLPGKLHGQRSLAGYSPWGRKGVGYDLLHGRLFYHMWICRFVTINLLKSAVTLVYPYPHPNTLTGGVTLLLPVIHTMLLRSDSPRSQDNDNG